MFESKTYTYKKVFAMVKTEVESYEKIPDDILILACNTELQYLYAQVIKKQMSVLVNLNLKCGVPKEIETDVKMEDIVRINANGENFAATTMKNAGSYKNTFYESGEGKIFVLTDEDYDGEAEICYLYRPEEIESVNDERNVELPTEYVPMLLGALRTEAYKYINEDALSAKWANDYNAYREGFDNWVASTRPIFG